MKKLLNVPGSLYLDTRCLGIPCTIRIYNYKYYKPNPHVTDSDLDYYGYTECDYDVLDRKGYLAEWLYKKLKNHPQALEKLEEEISSYIIEKETKPYDY